MITFVIMPMEIDEVIKQTFLGERGAQMAEAVQKGMWVAGYETGEMKGEAKATIKVLRSRFGSVPDDIILAMGNMNDPIAIDSLLAHAATCTSLEDFADSL